jgi:hypothetical protein
MVAFTEMTEAGWAAFHIIMRGDGARYVTSAA